MPLYLQQWAFYGMHLFDNHNINNGLHNEKHERMSQMGQGHNYAEDRIARRSRSSALARVHGSDRMAGRELLPRNYHLGAAALQDAALRVVVLQRRTQLGPHR